MIQYSKQALKFLNKQDMPTVEPDAWDLKMLHDAESDPDCNEYVSSEDAMKFLGL